MRPPRTVRWIAAMMMSLAALSAVTALAAANTVPATRIGQSDHAVTLQQLAPPECAAIAAGLTSLIVGSDGDDGNNLILGSAGTDTIRGRRGSDCIVGGGGDDVLNGDQDDDVLVGGPGNDTLNGDQQNDTLNGGPDTDTCAGGAGTDTATTCETISGVP